MKKAVLIVNPSSGNEEAKKYAGQAREKLEQFFSYIQFNLVVKVLQADGLQVLDYWT